MISSDQSCQDFSLGVVPLSTAISPIRGSEPALPSWFPPQCYQPLRFLPVCEYRMIKDSLVIFSWKVPLLGMKLSLSENHLCFLVKRFILMPLFYGVVGLALICWRSLHIKERALLCYEL
jgi:hypothetical protein